MSTSLKSHGYRPKNIPSCHFHSLFTEQNYTFSGLQIRFLLPTSPWKQWPENQSPLSIVAPLGTGSCHQPWTPACSAMPSQGSMEAPARCHQLGTVPWCWARGSNMSQAALPCLPFKQAEVTVRKYILVIFPDRTFANVGQVFKSAARIESL